MTSTHKDNTHADPANVTYIPKDGNDHGLTEAFGIIFEAGKPVNVDQALAGKSEAERNRIMEKIRGNPQFSIAGEKGAAVDQGKAAQDKKLADALDSRTKDAAKARENATRAQEEAAAKERAAAQVRAIADARNAQNEE